MVKPLLEVGLYTFSIYAILLIAASVAAGALGAWVVLREKGSRISWWFVALAGTMTWWLFCRAMSATAVDYSLALTWTRLSYVAFPFLPSCTLQFAYEAVGSERKPLGRLIGCWSISTVFAVLSLTTNLLIAGVIRYPWGYYPKYGNVGLSFILFFVVTGGASVMVFRSAIRRLPPGRQRRRLTRFAAGYIIGFCGVIDFLAAYAIPIIPFGHFVAIGSILVVGSAIRRFQLFDITPAFAASNIISTMQEALVVTDDEGRIRIVNEALQSISGYTRAELFGRHLHELVTMPLHGDAMLLSSIGEPIPVSVSVSTLLDRGQSVGTVVTAHDMRERRRIESVLLDQEILLRTEKVRRAAELQYRTLIESMRDGIIQIDSANIVRYVNDPAAEMIGCTRDAAIGQPIAGLMNGELGELLMGMEGRRAVEWVTDCNHARCIEIIRSPLIDVTGETIGTIGVLTDITDRRSFERQLSDSAREWQETFDAIQMPLVLLNSSGVVLRANRAALAYAGRSSGESVGLAVGELGPGSLWKEIERAAISADRSSRAEFEELDTGSTWDIVIDIIDAEGLDRVVVAARDITSFVELQRSLRRTETMSALGALVGGVAHEVRNPLFAISSTIDAFEDLGGDRRRELIDVLREQIARLSDFMYGLLDFGKAGPEVLTPMPVGPSIEKAIAVCAGEASAKRVTISYQPAAAFSRVEADDARLRLAFRNIIQNAVCYSPEGGIVTVRAESLDSVDGPRLRCTVSDEGAGFDPPDIARVFEPFFTRRTGGTGLGLAITRAVIEQHRGTIVVDNRPTGGAIVSVELPLVPEEGPA